MNIFLALFFSLTSLAYSKSYCWNVSVIGMYSEEPKDLSSLWIPRPYTQQIWNEKTESYDFPSATSDERAIFDLFPTKHCIQGQESLIIWSHPQLHNKWLTRGGVSEWDQTWVVKNPSGKFIVIDEKDCSKYGINPHWKNLDVSIPVDLYGDYGDVEEMYVSRTAQVKSKKWYVEDVGNVADFVNDSRNKVIDFKVVGEYKIMYLSEVTETKTTFDKEEYGFDSEKTLNVWSIEAANIFHAYIKKKDEPDSCGIVTSMRVRKDWLALGTGCTDDAGDKISNINYYLRRINGKWQVVFDMYEFKDPRYPYDSKLELGARKPGVQFDDLPKMRE